MTWDRGEPASFARALRRFLATLLGFADPAREPEVFVLQFHITKTRKT